MGIDVFQNHAYYGNFPGFAILFGATVNAKQLLCSAEQEEGLLHSDHCRQASEGDLSQPLVGK